MITFQELSEMSRGVQNELNLQSILSSILVHGTTDITFSDGRNKFHMPRVAGFTDVSRNNRTGAKADVVLYTETGMEYPISIKKDGSEMWESADSYYAAKAKKAIDKLIKKGEVELIPHKDVYRLKPNIAIKATKAEVMKVVFGSDIHGKGCVVEKSFKDDFSFDENGALIPVTKITTSINDLKGPYEVYFVIRNDATRKWSKIYPGIRVVAVKKTRVTKTVKVVK